MKKIQDVILIGLGAIGMLYASKLRKAPGVRLKILVDDRRLERYRREGVYLNEERLDFNYLPADGTPNAPADLILIATKSHGFHSAVDMIGKFTGKETLILPLLNGITAPELIHQKFPWTEILYGFFLGHASVREGTRVYHDGVGKLYFGAESNYTYTENIQKLVRLFDSAGIAYEIPQDMISALWRKYVLNVGVNQASAVFKADYGTLQKHPEMLRFAEELMKEAVAVAEACHVNGTEDMADAAMKVILSMPPEAKTSMLQDILAGRPPETDLFAGTLCMLGEKHHIATPRNAEVLEKLNLKQK